jgi:CBS domain-containing protein
MTGLVSDVMTEDPLTVEPDETVEHASSLMTSSRIRHLPVTSRDRLLAILSMRDLARAAARQRVREVMHAPVVTVTAGDRITVAAERLLTGRFSSLPVVCRELIVGIVTTTDLVRIACETLGDTPIAELMVPLVSPVSPGLPVSVPVSARAVDAGHILIRDRLEAISIDEAGRPIGMVSAFDFLRRLLR